MRAMMRSLAILAALTAFGCGGEEEAADEEPMHETEGALAEHEAAHEPVDEWASVGPTAAQVPMPADFAGEASATINETNYGQALDAIEAELAE